MTSAAPTSSDRTCGVGSDIVRIKRYPNRRFYDRTSRKYVTLQEIEELVREGQTIDVRDSKSDEDLTRVVLTQILLERRPERMELFPVAMLHLMLQANDVALEFLRMFLKLSSATMESFQGSRMLPPPVTPFDWMRMFFPGFSPGPRPTEPAESPAGSVEGLSRRVAELEERIRQLESGPPPITAETASESKSRTLRRLEERSSR
jgi:polyhydroxyalkanoate synthesis repressor PhaR